MKIIRNSGTERVIDLVRPQMQPGHRLDVVTPSLSLFAFAELMSEASKTDEARLLLPPEEADLAILGNEADRPARNQLRTRWLAKRFSEWLKDKAEVRRAAGTVPQAALVVRDSAGQPSQAVLGSFGFSTDGLGTTPGNPLSLIQASETPEESLLLSQWFDVQWAALQAQPEARRQLVEIFQGLAAHQPPAAGTNYKGQRVNLDWHVKGSSDRDPRYGFRIYYHWHTGDQCMVVGSLPEHLDNLLS